MSKPNKQEQEAPQAPEQDSTEAPVTAPQEAPQGTLSASDVAALAGAAPKDFRRWMRASVRAIGEGAALPGKGGRYAYTQAQAEALALAYGASKASKGTQAPAALLLASLAPAAPEGEAPQA